MIKQIYYCDICKKQVSGKWQLNSLTLPVTITYSTHQHLTRKLDCCESCFFRIRNIIKENNFMIKEDNSSVET